MQSTKGEYMYLQGAMGAAVVAEGQPNQTQAPSQAESHQGYQHMDKYSNCKIW